MKTFHEISQYMWNTYPSLFKTPEQVVENIFLHYGTGFKWFNGAGDIEFHEESSEESDICNCGLIQNEKETLAKRSYWYDHHLAEWHAYQDFGLIPYTDHTCEYAALYNFPDDINEDWAKAILLLCDYIESVTLERFIRYHKLSACRMWIGCWDNPKKKIEEENPELDKYQVRSKLADFFEANVLERLPKEWTKVQDYAKRACQRLSNLYPDLEAYEIPQLTRKLDPPDFYIKPENRENEFYRKVNFTPHWDDTVLDDLRKIPTKEEQEDIKRRNEITSKLIDEILDEEDY